MPPRLPSTADVMPIVFTQWLLIKTSHPTTLPGKLMAANPTPINDNTLMATCHDLAAGCEAQEVEIGIKQHTAATMRATMAAAVSARTNVGQCKLERARWRTELRKADAQGEKVISHCRLRLTQIFGGRFSSRWGAAGFPDKSTMVPEVQDKRLSLLGTLHIYFEQNAAHQSADMGATADICLAAHEALSDARSGVNHARATLRAAVREKNKALKMLRKRMRGLIQELHILLADNDARWRRFGLKMPARIARPDAVSHVNLTVLGKGKVLVEWTQAPRAARFRIQVRHADLEGAEFENAATVNDHSLMPNHLLQGLKPGETIEVHIIAANDADEARPSPVSTVVVT